MVYLDKLIMFQVIFLLIGVIVQQALSNISIEQFGAIADRDDLNSQLANTKAVHDAVSAAAVVGRMDREVLIPNRTYYLLPLLFENLHQVLILNRGSLVASHLVDSWQRDGKQYRSLLTFSNCSNVSLIGGTIDGRGYPWWVLTIYDPKKKLGSQGNRPHLIELRQCTNLRFEELHLKNSPQFHMYILDALNLAIGNIHISVDRTQQRKILDEHKVGWLAKLGPEMFPFNTDGLDPQGTNIHIYNITCENYNDIVVVKPHNNKGRLSKCSENILVENATSKWGSGMAIGTVPPSTDFDCVRNVTFRNIHMQHPFKGVYIKTYPSSSGTAIIENVQFVNMSILRPVYWPIYIGPHHDGPGCLHIDKCKAESKVTIRNISFRDIEIRDAGLYPYLILCDKSNPCTGILLNNVHTNLWMRGGRTTRCFNAQVEQINTSPEVTCASY